MQRRNFLSQVAVSSLASAFLTSIALGNDKTRAPKIMLRSSWQTVNIGDIGHTPGVLALLEQHLPEANVALWPSDIGQGVKEMLLRRFPKLTIVEGEAAIQAAIEDSDFLLHGSGPSLVAANSIERWKNATKKPYGVFGITLPESQSDQRIVDLLSGAQFVYFRDSASLKLAKSKGVASPLMAFGPDGAFAVDVRDDLKAIDFLSRHDLLEGQFLCCIPRYRNTPYWLIERKNTSVDETKLAVNDAMKEQDCRPLREAIIRIVRETSLKVLVCPEDETQMKLGKELIIDQLPNDVRQRVVWRENFWLTDEAVSTYIRSAGLFGHEMHSPIMCIGNGVPAIVCRWKEQTSKGIMWRDIGLGEWLFDFDRPDERDSFVPAVLELAKNLPDAKAKAARAQAFVRELHTQSLQEFKETFLL